MQSFNNVQSNLEKLADIKESSPSATHLYIRRVGKDNLIIDIPIRGAEETIRMWPLWEVVASNKDMEDDVEKLFLEEEQEEQNKEEPSVEVPPRPSERQKKRGRPKKNVSSHYSDKKA